MNARVGDIVTAAVGGIRPTQSTLGFDEIYSRLGRCTLGKSALPRTIDYATRLRTSVKSAVIGPGSTLHLTDGHHTFTTLAELADGGPRTRVPLRIIADLSTLPHDRFWQTMHHRGWAHLRDAHGRQTVPAHLPLSLSLSHFDDDELRSVLYFARGIGYRSTDTPFQEFHWIEWLRGQTDLDLTIRHEHSAYLDLVERVTRAQVALTPDARIAGTLTAADLGVMPTWNDGLPRTGGAFARLASPYEAARPGRLAYALEFRALHGIVSADPAGLTAIS